jgi:2-polyprenyl-3-methyl-5-hydroxy-6-metoxy-1,4-benzoquinol methylase
MDYTFQYPWLSAQDHHIVSCCLCNGTNAVEDVFSFSINNEPYFIRRCIHDDIMFLFPQPGEKFQQELYNQPSYFTGEDDMYGLAVSDDKSTEVAKIRIAEVQKYFPQATSILEIGCGFGHTLVEAKNAGFAIAEGIEFSEEAVAAAHAKGIHVVLGSANNVFPKELDSATYDIVALYSVLEHLNNPKAFLQSIKKYLHANSMLVIRVPRMSPAGPWLSLVDHLWHFSENSLRTIIEKEGMFVKEIFPSGTFVGTTHPGELKSMTALVTMTK